MGSKKGKMKLNLRRIIVLIVLLILILLIVFGISKLFSNIFIEEKIIRE